MSTSVAVVTSEPVLPIVTAVFASLRVCDAPFASWTPLVAAPARSSVLCVVPATRKATSFRAEAAPAPPAPPAVPDGIATVNGETAFSLVASADELAALDQLEAEERASENYPGGRKGVLKAIAARREELGR